MYDVIVIGGGVIGGAIIRELSRYQLEVCLLEKENDVCMGQSKANSGIVHAGFDAKENTLKAKFNLLGNKMMKSYAETLGVKYKNNGSLVVAFSEDDLKVLSELKARGERNGVDGLEIITREKLLELEPNISSEAVGALYATTGGIVCPYELTIAEIGNAMDNGAKLLTNFEVVKIDGDCGDYTVYSSDGDYLKGKVIVNASGLSGAAISALVGDNSFKIGARRGEYVLLDKNSGSFVNHTLFFTPTAKGKGILVSQTVDGNIILGPTAEEIGSGDTDTTAEGLSSVLGKAKVMTTNPPIYNSITSFSGVRAYSDRHDFIIEESKVKRGFINCVGIESPGLTSAPAIGQYVVKDIIGKILTLNEKPNFIE
ncbi:MAG: FAD-dependent oxidoreductase, partial [Clostridia bacterium]|nr:FAD-dependent oxidoreductase [Clostridia bacterium]